MADLATAIFFFGGLALILAAIGFVPIFIVVTAMKRGAVRRYMDNQARERQGHQ